jgi:hypothetical protein
VPSAVPPSSLSRRLLRTRRSSRLGGEAITPHGQPGDPFAVTDAPLRDAGVTRHFGVVSRYSPGEMNRSPVRSTHPTPADIAVRAQRLRSVRRRAHLRRDCPADRGRSGRGPSLQPIPARPHARDTHEPRRANPGTELGVCPTGEFRAAIFTTHVTADVSSDPMTRPPLTRARRLGSAGRRGARSGPLRLKCQSSSGWK